MKYFDWDVGKNEMLKNEREVSFEDTIEEIISGELIDIMEHPNKKKYPNQKFYIVNLRGYVYMIPYVENDQKIFLKTIFPSRKMTEIYKKKGAIYLRFNIYLRIYLKIFE